jgi:hypothetical protein
LKFTQFIRQLTVEDAMQALVELDPIRFHYKADKEDESLGFIAEDVPELIASKDRKSMSPMGCGGRADQGRAGAAAAGRRTAENHCRTPETDR